ncbi:MAG: hypothetical protein Sapg2KO_52890 [Saprospiraceae bacterium]
MKNIDQDFNTIQDFIDGKLSQEAADTVRGRLDKEPDLAKLYQHSKAAIEVVRAEAEQSTMALLQSIQQSENLSLETKASKGKIRSIKPFRLLSIAAVLIVLIVAAVWVFLPGDQNMVAFNEYYETPAFDLERGGEAEELLLSAGNAYNQKDFEVALNNLEAFENTNGVTTNTQLYRAIAHLELDQTTASLAILNTLSKGTEQLDQVFWLKALAHLKAGEKEAAITALKTLQSGSIVITPSRKQKIAELLEAI